MTKRYLGFTLFAVVFAVCLGAQNPPSPPPNPFAAPQAKLQYAPDREFDLVRVALDLNVDYSKLSFQGRVVNTVAPLRDGLATIRLDAGANLNIEACEIDGRNAEFTREGNILRIRVPQPLHRGKQSTVSVRYTGGETNPGFRWIRSTAANPQRVGFWTAGQPGRNHGWIPIWDYPNDFAVTETRVTVPEDWYVVGNGALKSNTLNKAAKTRTFHWQMDQPHATYLLSLAAGPVDVQTDEWRGVPLMYIAPRGKGRFLKNTFDETPEMLSFYSDLLGVKYPYPKYAQAAMYDFGGGLENISATIYAETGLADPRRGYRTASGVIAHELAHQWFGDLVTYKHWGEVWLGEGFAMFFGQGLYTERWRGKEPYDLLIEGESQGYFQESRRYKRPLSTTFYANPGNMFDSHSYSRGGLVLHTLRRHLGGTLFYQGIQHYLVKYRNTPVDSFDFRNAMTESTGINLEAFFDQWVFKPGHPVLDYAWTWDVEKKQVVLAVKQIQDTNGGTPTYDLNAAVGLISNGQVKREKIKIDKAEHEFRLTAASKPDAVLLDPDHDFLREIPNLKWTVAELPEILRHAPNAADRQEAMNRMLRDAPSEATIETVVAALRQDNSQFPVFRSIDPLAELKRENLRLFFRQQLAHRDINRRAQAVRALGRLSKSEPDTQLLRSLVNDREAYAVLRAAVQVLADWDAPSNRDVFKKAVVSAGQEFPIRGLAYAAMAKADAVEGKGQSDPNPQITEMLKTFLSQVATSAKDSTLVTEAVRNILLDANAARDATGWLNDLRSFTFVGSEDLEQEGVERRGSKASRVLYYRMLTGSSNLLMSFFLTTDGKIADVVVGPA